MEFEDHYVTCSLKHTMEHWLWCAVLAEIESTKCTLFKRATPFFKTVVPEAGLIF
jgi:hypothetical protein